MNKSIAIAALAVILAAASCRKDDDPTPAPPTTEPRDFLAISLHESALQIGDVDSADVVFRLIGSNTQVKERFVKKDNRLIASNKALTPGTWQADVEIYTKTVNQVSNLYTLIKPVNVVGSPHELTITGPAATNGKGWVKHHVKASAGNQVVIIVPEDVYDSRFEFRTKLPGQLVFGVHREAINVNYVVDEKSWACTGSCQAIDGRIINNTHFLSFSEITKASPWTRSSISMAVINEKSEVLLEYDRDWVK